MNKLRENIRKAVNRYINEMADQIMIDQPLEAPEYEYEPTPNNPTVQQYLDALEEWWARNHDDLYDFDNFIMALDIFEDKVKAERDNFAAEMGVDRKFIKEEVEGETNLESELKKIDSNLVLMPNRVKYNKADDMPENIFNAVVDLLEKNGIEVNMKASTTMYDFEPGERPYYAAVYFKPNYNM